jgi:hypothetical protein
LSCRRDPEFDLGGGGLYGTAGDYARFVRMVLNRGELDGVRVLDAETVDLMCQNAIGDLRVTPMKTVMPQFSNDAEFFPGAAQGMGSDLAGQSRTGAYWSFGGQSAMGWHRKLVLLDRSSSGHWRCVHDTDLAVCRHEIITVVRGVRDGSVPRAELSAVRACSVSYACFTREARFFQPRFAGLECVQRRSCRFMQG